MSELVDIRMRAGRLFKRPLAAFIAAGAMAVAVVNAASIEPSTFSSGAPGYVNAAHGTTGLVRITAAIVPGATETLTVADRDLNVDAAVIETVLVKVTNARTGEFETVMLAETDVDTGVFRGTLATNAATAAGVNDAAPLNVSAGDTVRVTYRDALTSNGESATVAAEGAVVARNSAPVAVADRYGVNEDVTLTVLAAGVLGNDTDAESNALIAVLVRGVTHGTLTLNRNGSFTYTPAASYHGSDSFTYKANDGTADSNIVTVTFTIDVGGTPDPVPALHHGWRRKEVRDAAQLTRTHAPSAGSGASRGADPRG